VTLFTPTLNGLYRITAYADVLPQSTGDVCTTAAWTDESGNQSQAISLGLSECALVGSYNAGGGSLIVHALPYEPVSLTVSLQNGFNGVYNLFVTVEQL
jgi:hypothetical protein